MAKRKIATEESNKEIILNAAIELFSENGYANTSIRDITRRSEVSIGTLYFHFKNKKDILKEVFMRLKPVFSNLNNECSVKLSFAEYFILLGKNLINFCVSNLGFNILLINESIKDPELSSFFYEQFSSEISIITQKLSEYSKKDNLRKIDYEKMAINLLSSTFSLAIFNGVFKGKFTPDFLDDMLESIIDVNINGLIKKR